METPPPDKHSHTYNYELLDDFLTTGPNPKYLAEEIDNALWAIVCKLTEGDTKKQSIRHAYFHLKKLREILTHLKKNK